VRKELRRWLRRLHDELHITSVFVTHDQEEALEVADRVVVLNRGHIEQVGSPAEVYHHPATPFVVEFLGQANKLPATVQGDRADVLGWQLPAHGAAQGENVAYVRPSDWSLAHHAVDGSQVVTLRDIRGRRPALAARHRAWRPPAGNRAVLARRTRRCRPRARPPALAASAQGASVRCALRRGRRCRLDARQAGTADMRHTPGTAACPEPS